MIIPPKLKVGNKISIISTARKISLKEITPAVNILKSWGLEVILANNIFKENMMMRLCLFILHYTILRTKHSKRKM